MEQGLGKTFLGSNGVPQMFLFVRRVLRNKKG
jgi:hypothetical protein